MARSPLGRESGVARCPLAWARDPNAGTRLLAGVTRSNQPQLQLARALERVLDGPLDSGQREGARAARSELRHKAGRAVELPGLVPAPEETLEQRESGQRRVVVQAHGSRTAGLLR